MKFYGYADNGQQVWFAVPTNRNGKWEAVVPPNFKWFFFNGEFLPVEEYKMVVTAVIGCGYREISVRFVERKSNTTKTGGKYEFGQDY